MVNYLPNLYCGRPAIRLDKWRIMIYDLDNDIQKKQAVAYFKKMLDDKKKVKVEWIRPKRSIKQNAFLHVCIDMFAVHFGYKPSEAKILLKRMCPFMTYEKKGQKFLIETSQMTDTECGQFIEWVLIYSNEQGCYIPDAEEYLKNKEQIDREISLQKQYL